jgi:PAS domain S-box-containing protein
MRRVDNPGRILPSLFLVEFRDNVICFIFDLYLYPEFVFSKVYMKGQSGISPSIQRFLNIAFWIGIIIVCVISILALLGWIFDIPSFMNFSTHHGTSMRVVTAICLLFSATALIFLAVDIKRRFLDYSLRLAGFVVSLTGLMTLLVYFRNMITGEDYPITSLPFLKLWLGLEMRMAFLTAVTIFLIGLIIIILTYRTRRALNLAHSIIIVPLTLGYLVLISYILGIYTISELQAVPVAFNTGLAVFFLSLAILLLYPETWLMRTFMGRNAGSQMARKLLPGVLIFPIVIGWLRIEGEMHGLFQSAEGVVFVALTYTLLFIWMIWLTAGSVNKTDRERARNEALLTEAERIGRNGSWEWNIKTGELIWSDQLYRMFGKVKGKFAPTFESLLLSIHPEDRKHVEEVTNDAITGSKSFAVEYRILPGGDAMYHISARADALLDDNGQLERFVGTALDITDVKKAEEALLESKERYITTLASIGDAVIASDVEGNITYLNRVGEEVTGWKLQEAAGRPVQEVFHIINENTRLEVENPVNIVLKKGIKVDLANHTILIRKDGTEVPIDDSGAPIQGKDGHVEGVVLVFRDITERRKKEKFIYESEQRLRYYFENSPLAIVEWDSSYNVTQWSIEAEHLFGWTREETIGKPIASLSMIFEEDIPIVEDTMRRLSGGKERTVVSTNRNYTKQGNVIECTWFNSLLVEEEGEMESVMSLVLDITERKKAEGELIKSEKRYQLLVDSLTDFSVLLFDLEHRFLIARGGEIGKSGFEPGKIEGHTLEESFPQDVVNLFTPLYYKALKGESTSFEHQYGEYFYFQQIKPVFDRNGEIYAGLVISHNITDQKRSEEMIRNSEATLHLAQQASNAGTWDWDITRGTLNWAPELFRLFGLDPAKVEATFAIWESLLHQDDIEMANQKIEKALKEHTSLDSIYRIIRPDGKTRWVRATGEGIYNEDGAPVRMLGICQDITELKKMEEHIRYEAKKALMLSDLSKVFTEAVPHLADIFNIIAKQVAEVIGDVCFVTEMSDDGNWLIPTAFYHPDPEALKMLVKVFPHVPIRVGESYAGQVALTGKSILVSGISREQIRKIVKPEFWGYLDQYGVYDYLIVPLKTGGQVIGTLGVMRIREGNSYVPEDQAFLEVIASRAAMAITNSRLFAAIQESHSQLEQKVKERTSELNKTLTVLSNEQKRFREVLDMLPSYVALLTPEYNFSFFNREFRQRFGDPDGRKCFEYLYNREEPCENCLTSEVLKTDRCELWEWEGPDEKIYEVTELPFNDADGTKLVLKIGSDVSNIRQAEADRIAREVAESANRSKSEFLANISHEIRTPMNAIIGFSELLSSTVKDEKQLSQVNAIRSSGRNLLSLINDILDLAKIEAGKMRIQPEPVNFPVFISELENVFKHRAEEKGIGFYIETEKDIPPSLLFDETRLRQILNNLLDNAIKFTDEGHVILIIDRLLKKDDMIDLVISVEDTGIGIPEDQHDTIFHAFGRQKGLSESKYSGTGLGLTITRRLTEIMNGSLDLKSRPGQGSIFTVILPNIPIVQEFKAVTREKIFDVSTILFEKSKVLIVDDNFENRKLLIDLLGFSPLDLYEAANGKEALALGEEYLPDLIIMDLRMPEMSGYEATRILKSQESTKNIPVIALSASPKIVFKGHSNKEIFDDFLLKPVVISDLAELLKKYLPHRVLQREATDQPEKPGKKARKLNRKEKQNIRELINTLETEFLPSYNDAMMKQAISQIELFGRDLTALGEKTGSGLVMDYGRSISKYAETFDVELLMEKLREFPAIIASLNHSLMP